MFASPLKFFLGFVERTTVLGNLTRCIFSQHLIQLVRSNFTLYPYFLFPSYDWLTLYVQCRIFTLNPQFVSGLLASRVCDAGTRSKHLDAWKERLGHSLTSALVDEHLKMNFSCFSFVMKIPWLPSGGGHGNPLVSLLVLLLIVSYSSCDNSMVKAELSPQFFAEAKKGSCPGLEPTTFENQVPMGRLGHGNSSLMTYTKVAVSSAGECVQKCCEEGGRARAEKCNMVFMFVNNTSLNCYLVRHLLGFSIFYIMVPNFCFCCRPGFFSLSLAVSGESISTTMFRFACSRYDIKLEKRKR